MASCKSINDEFENKREERRKHVFLGDLPADFLRVAPISSEQQLSLDEQTALALQHHYTVASSVSGRVTITIVEAKLNKNYGITRMDPYVRLKVSRNIYETNTDYNGARNPKWNKQFNCFFISQDTTLHFEIFDECAFSLDEKIAWASYEIPKNVLQGATINEWVELSGKLGEGKEGSINIIITCQTVPTGALIYQPKSVVTMVPYGPLAAPEGVAGDQPSSDFSSELVPPTESLNTEELNQISEMFPNIDREIVSAILLSNKGNKEHTINALLELSDTS